MSAYDPTSLILSGTKGDVNALISSLKDDLPVLVSSDGHTGFSYAPGGSTTFSTIDSIAITAESDEAIIVVSTGSMSGSSVSHSWYLRHNFSGASLNAERSVRFTPTVTDTGGQQVAYAVCTAFADFSGAKTVVLEVGNSDSGPSSTFYSNVGTTYVFQLRRR